MEQGAGAPRHGAVGNGSQHTPADSWLNPYLDERGGATADHSAGGATRKTNPSITPAAEPLNAKAVGESTGM